MSVGIFSTLHSALTSRTRFCASSSFSAVRALTASARAPSRAASTASLTPSPGPIPETMMTLSLSSMTAGLLRFREGKNVLVAIGAEALLEFGACEAELLECVLVFRAALARMGCHVGGDSGARLLGERQADAAVDALDHALRLVDRLAEVHVDERVAQLLSLLETVVEMLLERRRPLARRLVRVSGVTAHGPQHVHEAGEGWHGDERIAVGLHEYRAGHQLRDHLDVAQVHGCLQHPVVGPLAALLLLPLQELHQLDEVAVGRPQVAAVDPAAVARHAGQRLGSRRQQRLVDEHDVLMAPSASQGWIAARSGMAARIPATSALAAGMRCVPAMSAGVVGTGKRTSHQAAA